MKLPLAYYGNPILRKKGMPINEITDEIRELVTNMIDTMHENNGIGLAAPQVHKSLFLFITQVPVKISEDPEEWDPGQIRVFINPKILEKSEEEWDYEEGCLSIPAVRGNVVRPFKIKIRAMDLEGKIFEEEFSGLQARCCMHENDHINGVLFIDRIHGKERKLLERELQAVKKKYS